MVELVFESIKKKNVSLFPLVWEQQEENSEYWFRAFDPHRPQPVASKIKHSAITADDSIHEYVDPAARTPIDAVNSLPFRTKISRILQIQEILCI